MLKGYVIVLFIGILPILIAMTAELIGEVLDCNINEAGTDDCVRYGIHLGDTLSSMFIFGWFTFLSIPIGLLLFLGWTVYGIFRIYNQRKKEIH